MLRDVVPFITRQNSVGILLYYDQFRNKWLSASRDNYVFGIDHRNINHERWILVDSRIPTNILGFRVTRDGTITAASVETQNLTTADWGRL